MLTISDNHGTYIAGLFEKVNKIERATWTNNIVLHSLGTNRKQCER
jgi:pSer/pThr/pTyr-binding forkhead associated (FHA) protein